MVGHRTDHALRASPGPVSVPDRETSVSLVPVGIINYGIGNLGSVLNMFRRIDVEAEIVATPDELRASERLLLPGVGAFDAGVRGLRVAGLDEVLSERVRAGVPLLGICLGAQLLTDASAEGDLPGLGLIRARCERLTPPVPSLRVPHMGWAYVEPQGEHAMRPTDQPPQRYYFAHSFAMHCTDPGDVAGVAQHGERFAAVVARDNVCGAQFHPEKSHHFGMGFLARFAQWSA